MWVMDLFHFASIYCFERCYRHPGLWFPFGQETSSKWWPLSYAKVFIDLLGERFEKCFHYFYFQPFVHLKRALTREEWPDLIQRPEAEVDSFTGSEL